MVCEVLRPVVQTLVTKMKNSITTIIIVYCKLLDDHFHTNESLFPTFSKNLGTFWDDFGKEMEGEDEIEIGEVDCGLEKQVCSKADIHSYPTFKVFYDGEEVAKYKGKVFEEINDLVISLSLWYISCLNN